MTSRNKIWMGAFLVLAALVAGTITFRLASGLNLYLDKWSRPYVENLESQGFIFTFFRWITELGSESFLYPFVAGMALVLWWVSRNWMPPVFFIVGSALGGYLITVIKNILQRTRPRVLESVEGVGYSFPSGHAMGSIIIYGMLIYFFSLYLKSKKAAMAITVTLTILILLIGFSRYILRVHFLTDVLGGFAFGFIFIAIWLALFDLIYRAVYKKAPSSPS